MDFYDEGNIDVEYDEPKIYRQDEDIFEEPPQLVAEVKAFERVSNLPIKTTIPTATGPSDTRYMKYRSRLDIALEEIRTLLEGLMAKGDSELQIIQASIANIPNLANYNTKLLIYAAVFNHNYPRLTKLNLDKFEKEYKIPFPKEDFLRYVRFVKKIL